MEHARAASEGLLGNPRIASGDKTLASHARGSAPRCLPYHRLKSNEKPTVHLCVGQRPRAAASCRSWALTHAEDVQFACYGRGSYYKRHSDAQNASRRVLTAIYYLNTRWQPEHGGRLRLFGRAGAESTAARPVDIDPLADRLLIFDSKIEHEVMPWTGGGARGKRRGGKSKGRREHESPEDKSPARCAVTQWFQDLAPPLMRSTLATMHARERETSVGG